MLACTINFNLKIITSTLEKNYLCSHNSLTFVNEITLLTPTILVSARLFVSAQATERILIELNDL